jgi:hypothetical protein
MRKAKSCWAGGGRRVAISSPQGLMRSRHQPCIVANNAALLVFSSVAAVLVCL